MRLIIIESPYRGNREENLAYLQGCILDSLRRGEAPFASHQLYTQALRDDVAAERDLGIRAGYAWMKHAALVAFYVDLGWSEGMRKALHRVKTMQMAWEERRICG